MLLQAAPASGLDQVLSQALRPWRGRRAVHDLGKVWLDLAVAVMHWLSCGPSPTYSARSPSDPTVSRLIAAVAVDGPAALAAVRRARAAAHEQTWRLRPLVDRDGPVILDLDATIVLAHSEKDGATPTWKRSFGFHPLLAFIHQGPGGTGEQFAGLLRIGKATSDDDADHIAVLTDAIAQPGSTAAVLARP